MSVKYSTKIQKICKYLIENDLFTIRIGSWKNKITLYIYLSFTFVYNNLQYSKHVWFCNGMFL